MKFNNNKGLRILGIFAIVLCLVMCLGITAFAAESTPVAEVNGTGYATLQAAIKEAQAGDTITLLGNVNENVTINKAITIDGAGKTYTGEIKFKNQTVTIKNVKFVNGNINQDGSSTTGTLTVENCTFTGMNANSNRGSYAIHTANFGNVIVNNCNANDINLLYIRLNTLSVTVTGGIIDNTKGWGAHLVPDCTAIFDDVTFKNLEGGIVAQNPGDTKNVTFKNCKFIDNIYPVIVWNKTGSGANGGRGCIWKNDQAKSR